MLMTEIMDIYSYLVVGLQDDCFSDFLDVHNSALTLKNPTLLFNQQYKAGVFNDMSEDTYEEVIGKTEEFSALWASQPEISVFTIARHIALFMYVSRDNECKNMAFWKSVAGDFLSSLCRFCYLLKMYENRSKKEEDPDPLGLEDFEEPASHNSNDYDPVAKAAKEGLLDNIVKETK